MINKQKAVTGSLMLACGLFIASAVAGPYDGYMNANCPQGWQELAAQWSASVNDDSESTVPKAMKLFINGNGDTSKPPPWALSMDTYNAGITPNLSQSSLDADRGPAQANVNTQPYTIDGMPNGDELQSKFNDQLTIASNCLAYVNMVVDAELAPVVAPTVGSPYGWLPAIFN